MEVGPTARDGTQQRDCIRCFHIDGGIAVTGELRTWIFDVGNHQDAKQRPVRAHSRFGRRGYQVYNVFIATYLIVDGAYWATDPVQALGVFVKRAAVFQQMTRNKPRNT